MALPSLVKRQVPAYYEVDIIVISQSLPGISSNATKSAATLPSVTARANLRKTDYSSIAEAASCNLESALPGASPATTNATTGPRPTTAARRNLSLRHTIAEA